MTDSVRQGYRAGTTFAIVLIFVMLIGFNVTAAEIIEGFLNIRVRATDPHVPGQIIFMILMGIWAGANAARSDEQSSYMISMVSGLTGGLVSGVVLGFMFAIFGELRAAEIDAREYLVQFSPLVIRQNLLDQPVLIGLVLNVLLMGLSGLAGGVVRQVSFGLRVPFKTMRDNLSATVQNNAMVKGLNESGSGRNILIGVFAVALLVVPQFSNQYWNFVLGTIGIYVLMGLGLNLVVGFAGLLDIGYVAFFAVGAYTVGLLTSPDFYNVTQNFWLILPLGVLFAATAGLILGIPVLRLRGDYLAIVTLGLGEIIRILIKSDVLIDYLGGPQGVRNIAQPTLFGYELGAERAFLYLIFLGCLWAMFVTVRLRDSRVGRAWMAMREDETVARAMGINLINYKLLAFGMGASLAGLAGTLFASRNQFTGPEDHVLLVSINVLSEVIVGGMGSIPGVILGAFALKGLPEILRQLENYRVLAFGALLVIMMILRPEGLWPSKRRRRFLHLEEELDHSGDQDEAVAEGGLA